MTESPTKRKRRGIEAAVWVSPARRSGGACVMGTRVPTRMVADYMWDDAYMDLIEGFDLTRGQILVACTFEAEYGAYQRQWDGWVVEHFKKLWHSNWKSVPNPPTRLQHPNTEDSQ